MTKKSMEFAQRPLTFKCGTGKDAKIFIKFIVQENGENLIYNLPLLTLNSIQLFTSKPKVPRYVFGSANPVGVSKGIRVVQGYVTAFTINESIGMRIRKLMEGYKPVSATNLELETDGVITLTELDLLTNLDQLPPSQINIFITNPDTGKIFSKTIYGVVFTTASYQVGDYSAMGEAYSFMAQDIGELKHEEISEEK